MCPRYLACCFAIARPTHWRALRNPKTSPALLPLLLLLAAGVELLASGAKDSEVRVWDTASGSCLAVAAGHVAAVMAVGWSRSKSKVGRYLATGGADKLLKLWDTSGLLDRDAGRSGVCVSLCVRLSVVGRVSNAVKVLARDLRWDRLKSVLCAGC